MWLRSLSNNLEKQEVRKLLERVEGLTQEVEKQLADAVLEVSIRANQQAVEELRGDEGMCQALLEIMEPEIIKIKEEVREETRQEIRQETILRAVKGFRDLGADDDRIKELLKENYDFSDEEAEEYL